MNIEFIKLNDLNNRLSNIDNTNNNQDNLINSLQSDVNSQEFEISNIISSGVNTQNEINFINSQINDILISGAETSSQINIINNQITDLQISGTNLKNEINFIKNFKEIDVIVSGTEPDYFYVFNNIEQTSNSNKNLKLKRNQKYIFDLSDSSNSNFTLRFSDTPDGIHNSGTIIYDNIEYNSGNIIFNDVNHNIIFPFCLEVSGFCGTGNNSSYISFDNSPRIINGDKNLKIDEFLLVDNSNDVNLYLPSGTGIKNSDQIKIVPLNNGTGTIFLNSINFNNIINSKTEIYFYNQWYIT